MEDLFRPLTDLLRQRYVMLGLRVVDVLLVAFVIYRLLALAKGTRAWRIIVGCLIFTALLVISNFLHLDTLHWMLDKASFLAPVALVVLLLPELRQALEGVGKLGFWTEKVFGEGPAIEAQTIEEVVAAAAEMSASRVGALIVIEEDSKLEEVISNGVQVNARVSAPLLGAIFYEGNPLHDGAAIIRGSEIVAAACRLPLSETSRLDRSLHMRHRAAMGVSELYDCTVVVVSEERGSISISHDGLIQKIAGPAELRDALNARLRGGKKPPEPPKSSKKSIFARSKMLR